MSVYGKTVKESPDQLLERAAAFFGPGGLGLERREAAPDCAEFVGAGGHVLVTARPKGGRTEITLETREWDIQVQTFLGEL